ncbi:MAG: Ig-like domain-containing protein, partial [Verrucomicrobiota bacterium]
MTNEADAWVDVFWGTTDGGVDEGAWTYRNAVGPVYGGDIAMASISGLLFGVEYFYQIRATNLFGVDWADETGSLKTPAPVGVAVMENDGVVFNGTHDVSIAGQLNATGAVYASTLFWGPEDGATDPSAWAMSQPFGPVTNGLTHLAFMATLDASTVWYYRWRASNCVHVVWSDSSDLFANRPPDVEQELVTNGVMDADLEARITGVGEAELTLFWGPVDGGTNPAAWLTREQLGTFTNTEVATVTVTGLVPNTCYFFRFRSSNDFGAVWAERTGLMGGSASSNLNVISTAPGLHSGHISRTSTVEVFFDAPLEPASIDRDSVVVHGEQRGIYQGLFVVESNRFTFTSAAPFLPGDQVSVYLTAEIRNDACHRL